MNVLDLFNQGKLDEAVEGLTAELKQAPMNLDARWNLCELFCFRGELERADKQLDLLVQQDAKLMMSASLFRQLIRGETARRECWEQGRIPELVGDASELVRVYLDLWLSRREQNAEHCKDLMAKIEELRTPVSGVANEDLRFGDIRDTDDFCGDQLEVLTSTGKYYWIPFQQIREIEFKKPEGLRDLLWLQVSISVNEGPEGDVFIPTSYLETAARGTPGQRVGLETDWEETCGGVSCGMGRRTFWLDETDLSILELQAIKFDVDE